MKYSDKNAINKILKESSLDDLPGTDISEIKYTGPKKGGSDPGAVFNDGESDIMIKGRPTDNSGNSKDWPSGTRIASYKPFEYAKEAFFGELYNAILGDEHTPKTDIYKEKVGDKNKVYSGSTFIDGFDELKSQKEFGNNDKVRVDGLEDVLMAGILLGDSDLHAENIGYVEKGDSLKAVKIDHGFAGQKLTKDNTEKSGQFTDAAFYDTSENGKFNELIQDYGFKERPREDDPNLSGYKFNQEDVNKAVEKIADVPQETLDGIADKYKGIMGETAVNYYMDQVKERQQGLKEISKQLKEKSTSREEAKEEGVPEVKEEAREAKAEAKETTEDKSSKLPASVIDEAKSVRETIQKTISANKQDKGSKEEQSNVAKKETAQKEEDKGEQQGTNHAYKHKRTTKDDSSWIRG
jgi:hypothetical protein